MNRRNLTSNVLGNVISLLLLYKYKYINIFIDILTEYYKSKLLKQIATEVHCKYIYIAQLTKSSRGADDKSAESTKWKNRATYEQSSSMETNAPVVYSGASDSDEPRQSTDCAMATLVKIVNRQELMGLVEVRL